MIDTYLCIKVAGENNRWMDGLIVLQIIFECADVI